MSSNEDVRAIQPRAMRVRPDKLYSYTTRKKIKKIPSGIMRVVSPTAQIIKDGGVQNGRE